MEELRHVPDKFLGELNHLFFLSFTLCFTKNYKVTTLIKHLKIANIYMI